MTTILNGLLGGLVAGALAAAVARSVADEPSATAAVLGGALASRVSSSRWAAFAAWVVYGCLAGGLLVALELFVLGVLAVPPTPLEALGVAVVWSAVLFGTVVVLGRVASTRPFDRSRLAGLFVFHLVYGLGLGAWIRLTWIT